MKLSAAEIGIIAKELGRVLVPGLLQRVVEPSRGELLLGIYAGREQRWLYLSARAHDTRLHLVPGKPRAPKNLPRFAGLLRSTIMGARLVQVEQLDGDRRVAFRWVRRDRDTHEEQSWVLEARLFGTTPNVILWSSTGEALGTLTGRPPGQVPINEGPRRSESRFQPGPDLLDRVYEAALADALEREERELRTRLAGRARWHLRRARTKARNVTRDLDRARKAEELRRTGELLAANYHLLRKGMSSVTVVDYSSPDMPRVELPLDPALTPRENLDRCFKRHKALTEAVEAIEERLAGARELEAKAIGWLEELDLAGSVEELQDLDRRIPPIPRPPKPTVPKGRGPKVRITRLHGRGGVEILVGRAARDNDYLTFRVARGNDLWLHTRDWPGPHVVVRSRRGESPDREALLDAANLCVYLSRRARQARVADVTWTRVKHLRRGSKPGEVYVAGGKTIRVELDEARARALLASVDD